MIEKKLENDIIALYDSNLVNLFSINQISKKLNKKYPYINKKVTELLKRGILNKIVIGKSYLCSLNFNNEKTILLLNMHELQKKSRLTDIKKIEQFIDETRLRITVHSVISYRKNLVFVVENISDRREIQRKFRNCVVVDKKEFLDLLVEESQLFANHVVIYGVERFFELLKLELDELKRLYSPLKY